MASPQLYTVDGLKFTERQAFRRGQYASIFKGEYTPQPGEEAPAVEVKKEGAEGDEEEGEMRTDAPRDVAIKIMFNYKRDGQLVTLDRKIRFARMAARELIILEACRNANEIIHAYRSYRSADGQDLCMVMSYAPLTLLEYAIHALEGKQVEEKEEIARYILTQIFSGLRKLHQHNVAHRDLSVSNVLVNGETSEAFIIDFGMSRLIEEEAESGDSGSAPSTLTPGVVTLSYRAPEILLRSRSYGTKSDVWSAGMLLYCFVTGTIPIYPKDNTDMEALIQIIEKFTGRPSREYAENFKSFNAFLDRLEPVWREGGSGGGEGHNSNNKNTNQNANSNESDQQQAPPYASSPLLRKLADKGFSRDLVDVLHMMLQFDPADRADMNSVLQMPWFTESESAQGLLEELNAEGCGMLPLKVSLQTIDDGQMTLDQLVECIDERAPLSEQPLEFEDEDEAED